MSKIQAAIEVENLTRTFKGLIAIDGVSFEVETGEIFGFLGPNGAGKTTTVKMLCTLLRPTSGRARVAGFDIESQQSKVRKSIGIIFQDPSLDDRLTARENLRFHGIIYKIPRKQLPERIAQSLAWMELEDRADDLVRNFSGGMKRRLEIARGLLHSPRVLFLDEPTIGLDPQTRNRIWEYLLKLRREYRITLFMLLSPFVHVKIHLLAVFPLIMVIVITAFALTGVGVLIASRMTSFQGFGTIMNFVIMPMWFLSGAMFPPKNLPTWLNILVRINPLTYGVDLMRHLIIDVSYYSPLFELCFLIIFSVLILTLAVFSFNRGEY